MLEGTSLNLNLATKLNWRDKKDWLNRSGAQRAQIRPYGHLYASNLCKYHTSTHTCSTHPSEDMFALVCPLHFICAHRGACVRVHSCKKCLSSHSKSSHHFTHWPFRPACLSAQIHTSTPKTAKVMVSDWKIGEAVTWGFYSIMTCGCEHWERISWPN